jgi:hypothetical protein
VEPLEHFAVLPAPHLEGVGDVGVRVWSLGHEVGFRV